MIKLVGGFIDFSRGSFDVNPPAFHFLNPHFRQLQQTPADTRSLKVFSNGNPVKVKPSLSERNGAKTSISYHDAICFRKQEFVPAGGSPGQSFFSQFPCNSRFFGIKKFAGFGQTKNGFRVRGVNGVPKDNIQGLLTH